MYEQLTPQTTVDQAIPMFPSQYQFRTVKSIMVRSGTYNQVFTRPYVSSVDGSVLQAYDEVTRGGTQITPYSLAGVAGQIIQPNASPDASINVDNGWDAPRAIVFIEIEEVNSGLSVVLQGFADRYDLSHGNLIAPDLNFTINSALTLKKVVQQTPSGLVEYKRVVDSSHIWSEYNLQHTVSQQNGQGAIYTQRPSDIAHNLSLGFTSNSMAQLDGRTRLLPNTPEQASRINNNSSTYLSNTINAIRSTSEQAYDYGGNQDINLSLLEAATVLQDSTPHSSPVLRHILRNSNLEQTGTIDWMTLTTLFPDLENATDLVIDSKQVNYISNPTQHFESTAGSFEYWHIASYEAQYATTIFHAIPAIISSSLLLSISGTMTNRTVDGQPSVVITDARSFIDGFDRTKSVQQAEFRILNEIMPALTHNNQNDVMIAFNINLIRDGWVSISIGGRPAVEFSSPCFADGLYTPTIATNQDNLSQLAAAVNTLASQ